MRRLLATLAVVVVALATGRAARAYPLMIRRGYAGCGECHVDPSGGGVLTDYGRGQAEILLRTPWEERGAEWEPSKIKDFLFGAVSLPESIALQTDHRLLVVPEPGNFRVVFMQEDLRGAVRAGIFRASGSVGWVSTGALAARLLGGVGAPDGAIVAREYWAGVAPSKQVLVRAGRMNLPFGIRTEEHLLYVRQVTRTDTNAYQQAGLAASYATKGFRTEVMAIGGNPQVRPDAYRERGGSALVAKKVGRRAEVGVSALGTHAALDVDTLRPRTRLAQALFARWAPTRPLAIMAEVDGLQDRYDTDPWTAGGAALLEIDLEPVQGVHARATGEWCDPDAADATPGARAGWLTGQWFLAPHTDVRVDATYGNLYCNPGAPPSFAGMAQLHFFL